MNPAVKQHSVPFQGLLLRAFDACDARGLIYLLHRSPLPRWVSGCPGARPRSQRRMDWLGWPSAVQIRQRSRRMSLVCSMQARALCWAECHQRSQAHVQSGLLRAAVCTAPVCGAQPSADLRAGGGCVRALPHSLKQTLSHSGQALTAMVFFKHRFACSRGFWPYIA